jgi:hypothetical protein
MNCKIASNLLSKVTPVLTSIDSVLSKPEMEMVAPVVRQPLDDAKKELDAISKRCTAVVNGGGDGSKLDDPKDVAARCADIRKQVGLACNVLASIAKAARASS